MEAENPRHYPFTPQLGKSARGLFKYELIAHPPSAQVNVKLTISSISSLQNYFLAVVVVEIF